MVSRSAPAHKVIVGLSGPGLVEVEYVHAVCVLLIIGRREREEPILPILTEDPSLPGAESLRGASITEREAPANGCCSAECPA